MKSRPCHFGSNAFCSSRQSTHIHNFSGSRLSPNRKVRRTNTSRSSCRTRTRNACKPNNGTGSGLSRSGNRCLGNLNFTNRCRCFLRSGRKLPTLRTRSPSARHGHFASRTFYALSGCPNWCRNTIYLRHAYCRPLRPCRRSLPLPCFRVKSLGRRSNSKRQSTNSRNSATRFSGHCRIGRS